MLTRLSVRNLAIVESAEVEFGEGLNVVTGETGAGKSVLMGALELVLGTPETAAGKQGQLMSRLGLVFEKGYL